MKPPVLYHIEVSHYNEKVRWALDYKGIAHQRKAPMPMLHTAWAYAMTRGVTFPILRLDGEAIGDSTRIIGALEARYPDPPLYPADTAERERALGLEDFFDEELGPHMRRLGFYELLKEPDKLGGAVAPHATGAKAAFFRAGAPVAGRALRLRYGVNEDSARLAREKTLAALDRVAAEMQPSGYLVGDGFSVADLTAAALLYPLALPPEMPYLASGPPPAGFERFRESVSSHPAYDWVGRMYADHRSAWVPA
jgi:glutathione S-transferase